MFKELNHRAYLVGGNPRNQILGIPSNDLDYVLELTSEEELLSVIPEAKKVGSSFPVFLIKNLDGVECECALAREEVSVGNKYQDFEYTTGVNIYSDLIRRDFVLNQICIKYTTGELFDPYGGVDDIKNKIIRTNNPTCFLDDPLRILRGLRFACEFGFDIEENTLSQMKYHVGKLVHIPMERVDLELEKVYNRCDKPSEFFRLLDSIGGLGIHFKPFYVAKNVTAGRVEFHNGNTVYQHLMNSLDISKKKGYSFSVAMAGTMHDFGKIITPKDILPKHILHEHRGEKLHKMFLSQHRFDAYTQGLIILTGRMHMRMHLLEQMRPTKTVKFLNSIPKKYFDDFVKACDTDKELESEKLFIIESFKDVKRDTKIEIPTTIKNNVDAIKNFVHETYTKALTMKLKQHKELSK